MGKTSTKDIPGRPLYAGSRGRSPAEGPATTTRSGVPLTLCRPRRRHRGPAFSSLAMRGFGQIAELRRGSLSPKIGAGDERRAGASRNWSTHSEGVIRAKGEVDRSAAAGWHSDRPRGDFPVSREDDINVVRIGEPRCGTRRTVARSSAVSSFKLQPLGIRWQKRSDGRFAVLDALRLAAPRENRRGRLSRAWRRGRGQLPGGGLLIKRRGTTRTPRLDERAALSYLVERAGPRRRVANPGRHGRARENRARSTTAKSARPPPKLGVDEPPGRPPPLPRGYLEGGVSGRWVANGPRWPCRQVDELVRPRRRRSS